MTCTHCTLAATRPLWGGYQAQCIHCCARLIKSARPLRKAQDAMLAAVTRRTGSPSRAEILQALKAMDVR